MAFGINFVSGSVINCVVALGERLSSLGGTLVHDLWQTDVELDKKQNGEVLTDFPILMMKYLLSSILMGPTTLPTSGASVSPKLESI